MALSRSLQSRRLHRIKSHLLPPLSPPLPPLVVLWITRGHHRQQPPINVGTQSPPINLETLKLAWFASVVVSGYRAINKILGNRLLLRAKTGFALACPVTVLTWWQECPAVMFITRRTMEIYGKFPQVHHLESGMDLHARVLVGM